MIPTYLYKGTRGRIVIGVPSSEAEMLELVTDADRQLVATFMSQHRRLESLAWRALLYRELGWVAVAYDACGAPQLPEGCGYIGVSHSRNRVGIALSTLGPCALDIDSEERNYAAVARRYLSEAERLLSADPAWLCIAWCAKECLYKLGHRREIDLLHDIHLMEVAFDATRNGGTLLGQVDQAIYRLSFQRLDREWVVWYLP